MTTRTMIFFSSSAAHDLLINETGIISECVSVGECWPALLREKHSFGKSTPYLRLPCLPYSGKLPFAIAL